MAEVENQRLVIMPLLAKFNVYPKLYPCIAGCIVDSDIGNAICRAEDLPSSDNKPSGVDGDSAAIGKAG